MIPPDLERDLDGLQDLSRWERAELGRRLRRAGLTYREIAVHIPAAKSTIAGWCRDIELTDDQEQAIRVRTGSRKGIPRDTQWRRRLEIERIRSEAAEQADGLAADPSWLGGVTLYWAEGFKTGNQLGMANADPDLLRFFMGWTRAFHAADCEFRAKLNLHRANDERNALRHWATALDLCGSDFTKSFVKPDGTGHRKNHLPHGVCQLRMRRSSDALIRTLTWIDHLR